MQSEDRRRFALFMILMAGGVLAWSYWTRSQQQPAQPKGTPPPVTTKNGGKKPPKGTVKPTGPLPTDVGGKAEPTRVLKITTTEMEVRLSSQGAGIERLALRNHHPNAEEQDKPLVLLDMDLLVKGLSEEERATSKRPRRRSMVLTGLWNKLDFENWNWKLDESGTRHPGEITVKDKTTYSISFLARQGDTEFRKTYTFKGAGFDIDVAIAVVNHAKEDQRVKYRLVGAAGFQLDEPPGRFNQITAMLAGRDNPNSETETETVATEGAAEKDVEDLQLAKGFTDWAALRGRYFAAFLVPRNPRRINLAFAEALDPKEKNEDRQNLAAGLEIQDFGLNSGRRATHQFFLRAGPQQFSQLQKYTYKYKNEQEETTEVNRGMSAAVDFGWSWFAWISRWLLWLVRFFHDNVISNYGVCIMLVTLAVKLALHPLSVKGQKSMRRMQDMQPKIQALQKQFKGDPQKLQQAQMRLYKEEGINPAGGCLPMLLQMPVFFALYGAIRGAFVFRQASFLWINDLCRPDALFDLPFWPGQLHILPIFYAGLMILQGSLQPLPKEGQARQTAMMMRFMPLVFFFIIYRMPSAFVLYFAISSIVAFAENRIIKSQLDKAKTATAGADGKSAGASPDAQEAGEKNAPPPDPKAFWQAEGEKKKKGKGKGK